MSDPNPPCCIVGFGIAGQILLLELLQRGFHPKKILVIDENFLGGDLATQYPQVISNTPWQKTKQALEKYAPWSTPALQDANQRLQPHECHPVSEIARACLQTANAAIQEKQIQTLSTSIRSASHEAGNGWILEHATGKIQTKLLFMTHGSVPRNLMLPLHLPTIPLEIALDPQRLSKWVKPCDHVTVFGTAHSGVILLKNLHDLGVSTTAVYQGEKPFIFARDNEYDGLKQGSALIADAILREEYTNICCIPWSDTESVKRAYYKATYIIQAVGFQPRQIPGIPTSYSPQTAALGDETQNAYGFGIAYPGTTVINNKTYTDVSVSSFQDQIQRCLPPVLDQKKDFLE